MNKTSRIVVFLGLIFVVSLIVPFSALGRIQNSRVEPEILNNAASMSFEARSPEIDITKWSLIVDGFVRSPLNLTYDAFRALPAVTVFAELICYPSAFVTEGEWTGVQLSYLLTLAEVEPEAVDMVFYAVDGFSSSLSVAKIMQRPDMLLAYEKNGEPLTPQDGFPVIVVAPGQGGYKWVKFVTHIELVDHDHKGYWESAGYPDDAVLPNYNQTVPVPIIATKPGKVAEVPEFELVGSVTLILVGLLIIAYKKRTRSVL